jgi:hypothetical protein
MTGKRRPVSLVARFQVEKLPEGFNTGVYRRQTVQFPNLGAMQTQASITKYSNHWRTNYKKGLLVRNEKVYRSDESARIWQAPYSS